MKQKWLLPLREKALALIKKHTAKQDVSESQYTLKTAYENFSCRTKIGGYKFFHVVYNKERNDVIVYEMDFLKRIN